MKISQGIMGRVQGSSKCSFPLYASHGAMDSAVFPSNNVWQTTHQNVANQRCSPNPWHPASSIGTPSCRQPCSCLPTWLISVSSPSGHWADTTWPKTSMLNHAVRLSGRTQHPRANKTLWHMMFQGLRDCFPEAEDKQQTSSGQG